MAKTWLITGASRGFGRQLAEAVLETATGWSRPPAPPSNSTTWWPASRRADAGGRARRHRRRRGRRAAVKAAVDAFGRTRRGRQQRRLRQQRPDRGDGRGRLPRPDRDQPVRGRERHAGRAAGAARAALRDFRAVLLDRRTRRRHSRDGRLPEREVRGRRLLRSARQRGRAVRRQGHHRRAGAFRTDWQGSSMELHAVGPTTSRPWAPSTATDETQRQPAPGDPRAPRGSSSRPPSTTAQDPPRRLLLGSDAVASAQKAAEIRAAETEKWADVSRSGRLPRRRTLGPMSPGTVRPATPSGTPRRSGGGAPCATLQG